MSTYRRVLACLLLSAILFFIIALALSGARELGMPAYASAAAIALAGSALLAIARREEGVAVPLAGSMLALAFTALAQHDRFAPTLVLSVGMFAATFYLFARGGVGPGGALRKLGMTRGRLVGESLRGLFITIAIYVLLFVLSAIYAKLGMHDVDKVAGIILGAPLYLLALAVLINPVTEELFFRGMLAPRMGVVGSSAIFALFHTSYGSVAEVANVFIIGMIYAHVYLARRSLIAPMLSHILINTSAVYIIITQFAGAG